MPIWPKVQCRYSTTVFFCSWYLFGISFEIELESERSLSSKCEIHNTSRFFTPDLTALEIEIVFKTQIKVRQELGHEYHIFSKVWCMLRKQENHLSSEFKLYITFSNNLINGITGLYWWPFSFLVSPKNSFDLKEIKICSTIQQFFSNFRTNFVAL